MKKVMILTLILVIVALFASYVSAQQLVSKGIKGGINLANVKENEFEDIEPKMLVGFSVGGYITNRLSDRFFLQLEAYYSSKGFRLEHDESYTDAFGNSMKSTMDGTTTLKYFEIPVLGVFTVTKNLNIFAGPYLEIYLNGKTKFDYELSGQIYDADSDTWENMNESGSESEDIKSGDINSPGFGLIFGAEYLVGKISLGARYSMGLSNIPDNDEGDEDVEFKHKVVQFVVGIPL